LEFCVGHLGRIPPFGRELYNGESRKAPGGGGGDAGKWLRWRGLGEAEISRSRINEYRIRFLFAWAGGPAMVAMTVENVLVAGKTAR
jgi:hypothetical protein